MVKLNFPKVEILMSCFQALSDDYVTDKYKAYLENMKKKKCSNNNPYLNLLEKVDKYYTDKLINQEDRIDLGLDIMLEVISFNKVKFSEENISYMEDVAVYYLGEEVTKSFNLLTYDKGQKVLESIETLGLGLNHKVPLTIVSLRDLIEKLESDVKSCSISREVALETLEELEMSSVYTGDCDAVQKLSYIRGLINITRL